MASPLEELKHTAARTAALAMTDLIACLLRPEEQMEFCREAYALIRACIDTYDAEKSTLN